MSCPDGAARGASVSPSDDTGARKDFPRAVRITARRDFQRVYAEGRRIMGDGLVLFGLPNARGRSRLGLTVSRKCGGAVERNRIKRMLREVFRRHRAALEPALDLVVNARSVAARRSAAEIETEFLALHAALTRRRRP